MAHLLFIYGTRPEAIKLAPVIQLARTRAGVRVTVCSTGQHREMLDSVHRLFGITPDADLALMRPGQDLTHVTTAVLEGAGQLISRLLPDWVIVQGDTSSAFAATLAAFYRKVKVAHVEAGLRTGNLASPWPEEANRRLISSLASVHFPPTQRAADHLRRENIAEDAMLVTGNTVIDALQQTVARLNKDPALRASVERQFAFLDPARRLILITGHRRENFDGGLASICRALRRLAERGDVELVYPVHLNPVVQSTVRTLLADHPAVHLVDPLDYLPFVYLMQRCHFIITDSGGIQEEAPALGKPVLVTRDTTERPEAVDAGTALLTGTSEEALVAHATELLDHPASHAAMAQARNPFGDGQAARRILERMEHHQ